MSGLKNPPVSVCAANSTDSKTKKDFMALCRHNHVYRVDPDVGGYTEFYPPPFRPTVKKTPLDRTKMIEPQVIRADPTTHAYFIADRYTIRYLSGGLLTVLAGKGGPPPPDDSIDNATFRDGRGVAASFTDLYDFRTMFDDARDSGKRLKLVILANNRLRMLDVATGMVSTVAANGVPKTVDGVGLGSSFEHARSMAFDRSTTAAVSVASGGGAKPKPESILYVSQMSALRRYDMESSTYIR